MNNVRDSFGKFIKFKEDNFCSDCKKIISSRAKRCKSCNNKGKNNPQFGRKNKWGHHTIESKKKMGRLGRHHSEETKIKISKNNARLWKGKQRLKEWVIKGVLTRIKNNSYKHTLEQRRKLSEKMSGINTPNWKRGITPLNEILRGTSKWKIWRELIFLRDNFTCQNSNCEYCHNKIGVMLHPHHIKPICIYPKLIFNISNGITYCAEFHLKSGLHKHLLLEVN